jgi:hypothetical protein
MLVELQEMLAGRIPNLVICLIYGESYFIQAIIYLLTPLLLDVIHGFFHASTRSSFMKNINRNAWALSSFLLYRIYLCLLKVLTE